MLFVKNKVRTYLGCILKREITSLNDLHKEFCHITLIGINIRNQHWGDHTPLRFITTCYKSCYPILYDVYHF